MFVLMAKLNVVIFILLQLLKVICAKTHIFGSYRYLCSTSEFRWLHSPPSRALRKTEAVAVPQAWGAAEQAGRQTYAGEL